MKYFFIKIPNEKIINSLNVCVGRNATQKYSTNKKVLFVKTNDTLINLELNRGKSMNDIFPPGLVTEVTYVQARERLRSKEFSNDTVL